MANETYVTLTGRLGADPVLYLPEGKKPFVRVPLATSTRVREGEEWVDGHTSWYELKAWEELARNIAASLTKGTSVVVHGELRIVLSKGDDGVVYKKAEINIESIGANLRHAQTQTIRVRYDDTPNLKEEKNSSFSIEASRENTAEGGEPEEVENGAGWNEQLDAETALTS